MLGQCMRSQHITFHTPVLGAVVKVWGQGRDRVLQGQLLWEEARGCPVLETAVPAASNGPTAGYS